MSEEQVEVRPHERAVDAFLAVQTDLKAELEKFENGDFVEELFDSKDVEEAKTRFLSFKQHLRDLVERHNVALNEAKSAMRALVQIGPSQWRGPDGKPDVITHKGFQVSSVTKRSWDPEALFNHLTRVGAVDRYMALTQADKTGTQVPIIKQTWDIDYDAVKKQLQADGLQEIINGAYDEKESTPQAKGPKPLTYLGEAKESK